MNELQIMLDLQNNKEKKLNIGKYFHEEKVKCVYTYNDQQNDDQYWYLAFMIFKLNGTRKQANKSFSITLQLLAFTYYKFDLKHRLHFFSSKVGLGKKHTKISCKRKYSLELFLQCFIAKMMGGVQKLELVLEKLCIYLPKGWGCSATYLSTLLHPFEGVLEHKCLALSFGVYKFTF